MTQGGGNRSDDGLIPRILQSLTRSVCQRPGGTLWIVAFVSILALLMTVRFLEFKTNRADLIDPNATYHQRWMDFTEKFGEGSEVVVTVEAASEDLIRTVLDDLGSRLEREPELFDRVLYRVEPGQLKGKALQYLSPQELERAYSRLEMYGPILDGHWNRAGLESYTRRLTRYLSESRSNPTDESAAIHQSSRMIDSLTHFFASQTGQTNNGPPLQSPWPEIVSSGAFPQSDAFESHYQIAASGRMGFLQVVPIDVAANFSGNSSSLARLREILGNVESTYEDVKLGMTGIPVLEADEMARSQQDMMKASLISFAGVGLLLLLGFRGFRHPFLALIMLAVGLSWSLGYTTLVIGHLNILSVSFAAILIGLGIDFGIHYLARYLELRHHGEPLQPALVQSSMSVGTGIVTAAITTALAFLCATFTNFLGVAELGIIAGGGILLCGAATFVVLPALVAIADKKIEPRQLPTQFQGNLLRRLTRNYPVSVSMFTLAAIFFVGAQGFTFHDGKIWSRVEYDSNLLNLQADGVESVELQKRIFQETNGSLLYAVSLANSAEHARLLKEKYLDLPEVSRVEELGSRMPPYPASETGLLVQAIAARLERISDLPREFPQVDPLSIGQALDQLYQELQKSESAVAQESSQKLDATLNQLAGLELPQQMGLLTGYQQGMLVALHRQFQTIADIASPEPVSPTDFAPAIRDRFVSSQGDWQVRVYPTEQIWEEEPLTAFVDAVRTVDLEVTGTPLQNFEAARQIQESYFNAALYALAIIALILLIDSLSGGPLIVTLIAPLVVLAFAIITFHGSERSIDPVYLMGLYVIVAGIVAAVFDFVAVRNACLALLPPIAGGFLMFGILGLLGIDLNPANMIVLPLILGIGVDDGVHVIHDFRTQPGNNYETSPSTVNAVTLTSLTSMIGFGSMLVAAHQGLVSLGIVLVVGVGSCLFVSLVTLPAIIRLTSRSEDEEENVDQVEEEPHVMPITSNVA